jgi:hypothetical protein
MLISINLWPWILVLVGYANRFLQFSNRFLYYANTVILPCYIFLKTLIILRDIIMLQIPLHTPPLPPDAYNMFKALGDFICKSPVLCQQSLKVIINDDFEYHKKPLRLSCILPKVAYPFGLLISLRLLRFL